jgi:vancomycin resistance protein VanJ
MKLAAILRTLSATLAIGYLVSLVLVAAALRLWGERAWATTVGLYLPRLGWALPLPFVIAALAIFGPRRLLFAMPLALLLVLFPLMGLRLGIGALSASGTYAGRAGLRVLSFNVGSDNAVPPAVAVILAAKPDIVLVQEHEPGLVQPLTAALPAFHTHVEGQFFLLSRYRILDVFLPPKLDVPGSEPRSARFVRYTLETPLGPIDVFNVHPVSPRQGMEEVRGNGLLYELRKGHLFRPEAAQALVANAVLRRLQVQAVASEAARSSRPVIIAGDTNLPGLSWIFAGALARYRDGFAEVGRGFGYTYPASRPWMRIDRILTNERLAFRRFEVVPDRASDHLCVWAELVPE